MAQDSPPPDDSPPPEGSLADLCDHAQQLASDLTGPLRRMSVRSGDATIEVEWQVQAEPPGDLTAPAPAPGWPAQAIAAAEAAALSSGLTTEGPAGSLPAEAADGQFLVSSPMVGTFYRAPNPDADPFVQVGETVEEGQTVAIVEAMKLFNLIAAESAGVVAELLAEDGQPVEFGQPLLRLVADPPFVSALEMGGGHV
jgi:acetyl-CoA carboxylase biotin carboxyl carrier protein